MNKLKPFLFGLILSSCYVGEELPPDQEVWEYASPPAVGMDIKSLLDIDEGLANDDFGFINGLVIIKDDLLVFENYYDDADRQKLQSMGRLSFSVITLAMDIFIEEGWIESLDEPIYSYLPEYQNIFDADTVKKAITFRHILANKTGLAWDEQGRVVNEYEEMKASDDWVRYILSKPMETPNAGQRFSQNASGGILLAKIMQDQLGQEDLENYLHEHLFRKIGITLAKWEKSPNGVLNAANGLQLTTLEMTRIGYLMLLEGRWLEKRRILTRDWVFEVSSAQSTFSNQISYGYGWKIITDSYKEQIGLSGTSIYYMVGGQGQGLFIVPEFNLILTIAAENFFDNAESISFTLFLYTLRSLQQGAVN